LRVIIEPIYHSIGVFNDFGLAPACRSEKKCGFINKEGKETISPLYEEVKEFNKSGLVVVREATKNCTNNKLCKTDLVYDKTGKLVIDKPATDIPQKIKYEILDSLHSEKYIPIKMYKDDDFQGFHLVDPSDNHLVTTMPYHIITPFDQNQVFRVKKDNLWGLVDTSGKAVMKPMYAEIRKPSEGFYPVRT
jgi:WG containing repeat